MPKVVCKSQFLRNFFRCNADKAENCNLKQEDVVSNKKNANDLKSHRNNTKTKDESTNLVKIISPKDELNSETNNKKPNLLITNENSQLIKNENGLIDENNKNKMIVHHNQQNNEAEIQNLSNSAKQIINPIYQQLQLQTFPASNYQQQQQNIQSSNVMASPPCVSPSPSSFLHQNNQNSSMHSVNNSRSSSPWMMMPPPPAPQPSPAAQHTQQFNSSNPSTNNNNANIPSLQFYNSNYFQTQQHPRQSNKPQNVKEFKQPFPVAPPFPSNDDVRQKNDSF